MPFQHSLYPSNWLERAQAAKEAAGGCRAVWGGAWHTGSEWMQVLTVWCWPPATSTTIQRIRIQG
jgi:hypothetical protein